MTSCQPYISDAKMVASRLGQDVEEIQFMHFPIPEENDAVAIDSDVTRAVRRIVSAIAAGDRVYLHCLDGNGRTGTIAALILGVVYGISSSEALSLVQQYRDMRAGVQGLAVETHQQRAQVHRLLKSDDWRAMVRSTKVMRASKSNVNMSQADMILQDLRGGLMRRGPEAFIKLRRMLQQRDFDGDGRVPVFDVTESLHFLGRGIRDGDVVKMTRQFDPEQTGKVNYKELLIHLRGGEMPPQREQVCRDAFDKIGNHHGTSRVTLLDMKRHYQSRNVPSVKSGQQSEEEATSQFLETFFNAGVTDKQIVTWEDFLEYYTCVGAAFDEYQDRAFMVLLWDTWGLHGSQNKNLQHSRPAGGRPTQRDPASLNPGGPRHSHDGGQIDKRLEEDIYEFRQANASRAGSFSDPRRTSPEKVNTHVVTSSPAEAMNKIRECLTHQSGSGRDSSGGLIPGAGLDGGGVRKQIGPSSNGLLDFVIALRSRNVRGSSMVSFQDFVYALESANGLPKSLTRMSLDGLFKSFTSPQSGAQADSRSIVDALCGSISSLPQYRTDLVFQAFRQLDNGSGRVHIREVAKAYNAKRHPEVVSGRYSSDDAFFWFFDRFRKFCSSVSALA